MSDNDARHLELLRQNVESFLVQEIAQQVLLAGPGSFRTLEVGDEGRGYGARLLPNGWQVDTLDLNPAAASTYTADLCCCPEVRGARYGLILCTEVLEHTVYPQDAVDTMYRLLVSNGVALVTTPYNLRIHDPRPDLWRFTEDGLRHLFRDWEVERLTALETEGRSGMPIQYTLVARKP